MDNNNINIAHEVHGIQVNPLTSDINNEDDILITQDLDFDEAGHVIKN
jgi:hypothetical protein